ncbi:FAD-dependent monooxygenase [Micromonospora sp. PTRAS2]
MTDVLVAGAGPVGLTVTHELSRYGVQVRLVDAAAGPATTSRALAIHARTLEICDQMGVLKDLRQRARSIQNFTMHHRGRQLARFGPNYSAVPTRFPRTLMLGQMTTEEVLRDAVHERGVDVEWGTQLVASEERDGQVHATLRRPDGGEERVTVPWLVGCDGGHSTVRKHLGLPLLGDSTETWLIADCDVDMDLPQDSIHWIKAGEGTVMAIPFPETGRWRLLDTVDVSYDGDPDRVAERFAGKLRTALRRGVTVHRPHWVSVFSIQQRMVPAMQAGRRFVAGDAAHVHSPASGQGMNTGIQDAFNLAWKLALVVHGHAAAGLLETYSAERVPVGRALLGSTRKATQLVALRNTMAGIGLPIAFAVIRAAGPLRRRIESSIIANMSALNLRYRDGSLIGPDAGAGPAAGERVTGVDPGRAAEPGWRDFLHRLRTPGWHLVVARDDERWAKLAALHRPWLQVSATTTGGDGVTALDDRTGALRSDLGIPANGWVLVRPDGYLAARGDTTDDAAVALINTVTHRANAGDGHAAGTR